MAAVFLVVTLVNAWEAYHYRQCLLVIRDGMDEEHVVTILGQSATSTGNLGMFILPRILQDGEHYEVKNWYGSLGHSVHMVFLNGRVISKRYQGARYLPAFLQFGGSW